ncbi:CPBP family intramembrane glutamic endopeptidase [Aquimarina hainanensis]|uniref:CPBP family intramembrane glutamic endopeptidase n=1 Tax=Aquimarina hainanensis TaxID=1578017 RepID=UPI00361ED65B
MLLLRRDLLTFKQVDFFSVFWGIIIVWYLVQIVIIKRILNSSCLSFNDIGYRFNKKETLYFILGYLIFAFILFGVIEYLLASIDITSTKLNSLSDFSNLTPKTSLQRFIFIIAGLVAGISEEFVYRGFAINGLENHNINKWSAILIAAIPFVFQHGLKSLDQFWWFFITGIIMGLIYVVSKRKLYINIIIHWLVILSAMLAILQVL